MVRTGQSMTVALALPGDDLMRCVDLYNQAQSKWFEEMVTTTLVSDQRCHMLVRAGAGAQESLGGWWRMCRQRGGGDRGDGH